MVEVFQRCTGRVSLQGKIRFQSEVFAFHGRSQNFLNASHPHDQPNKFVWMNKLNSRKIHLSNHHRHRRHRHHHHHHHLHCWAQTLHRLNWPLFSSARLSDALPPRVCWSTPTKQSHTNTDAMRRTICGILASIKREANIQNNTGLPQQKKKIIYREGDTQTPRLETNPAQSPENQWTDSYLRQFKTSALKPIHCSLDLRFIKWQVLWSNSCSCSCCSPRKQKILPRQLSPAKAVM